MKSISNIVLITAVMIAGLFATGCPQRRSVADIQANPGRYEGKEVIIVGVVKDSYGLSIPLTGIRGGAYKLDDGTGSIWVVTDRAVPGKGAEVGVSGVVGAGLTYQGKTFGLGMTENKRRFIRR
jgi:hypothetical protein